MIDILGIPISEAHAKDAQVKTPLATLTHSFSEPSAWSFSSFNVPGLAHHVSEETNWPLHPDVTKPSVWGVPSSTDISDVAVEGSSLGWDATPLSCPNFGWGFSINPSMTSTPSLGASTKDMEER